MSSPELDESIYELGDRRANNIPIRQLRRSDSPRIAGENEEHVVMLAQSSEKLPPIVVHRQTMRVIDGMHRLKAAELSGAQTIDVIFYDGDEMEAFIFAVHANVRHGLPLSFDDRAAAAKKILSSHPHWSDRTISKVTGLAPKTVGVIRKRSSDTGTQSNVRTGLDGRVRPVNTATRRQFASELIKADPTVSIRDVAKASELAPSTVLDVRDRLRKGQDPVPPNQRPDGAKANAIPKQRTWAPAPPSPNDDVDRKTSLLILKSDPALRYSRNGQMLLRVLGGADPTQMPTWPDIMRSVPDHCVLPVAVLAKEIAQIWSNIATMFEQCHDARTAHNRKIT